MSGMVGHSLQERTTVLGERLTHARLSKSWRQRDVSTATDLAPSQITQWERGVQVPSIPNLIALADALEVSIDWLLGRTDVPALPVVAPA